MLRLDELEALQTEVRQLCRDAAYGMANDLSTGRVHAQCSRMLGQARGGDYEQNVRHLMQMVAVVYARIQYQHHLRILGVHPER